MNIHENHFQFTKPPQLRVVVSSRSSPYFKITITLSHIQQA